MSDRFRGREELEVPVAHRWFEYTIGLRRPNDGAPIDFIFDPEPPRDVVAILERNRDLFTLEGRYVFAIKVMVPDPLDSASPPTFEYFDEDGEIEDPTGILPEARIELLRKLALMGVVKQWREAREDAGRLRTAELLEQLTLLGIATPFEA